jgi:hypothetical protein
MALNGQALTAYKNYLNKSMTDTPEIEESMSGGLMNRNRPVQNKTSDTKPDYLLDQFKQLQKLRAGLNNG